MQTQVASHRKSLRLPPRATRTFALLKQEEAALVAALLALRVTRREGEVLAWVCQGKTNKDIGVILRISPRTVQKHLEHVYQKLAVETRTAAVSKAFGFSVEAC